MPESARSSVKGRGPSLTRTLVPSNEGGAPSGALVGEAVVAFSLLAAGCCGSSPRSDAHAGVRQASVMRHASTRMRGILVMAVSILHSAIGVHDQRDGVDVAANREHADGNDALAVADFDLVLAGF